MANIKDVAKQAGVSISTVSRVINDSKNVSPELCVKVERAIEDLGYSTNSIARGLKISETKRIAVIITSLTRTFFTKVLEGISKEAEAKGYSVLIAETHDNLDKEIELVQGFASQWVDGIILASSAYGKDKKTLDYIESLSKLKKKDTFIPVITLEYPCGNPYVDAVVINHEQAAYEAVNHLIRDVNRMNIVHISLPFEHYMGKQRINGYKRALEENNLPIKNENIIKGDYTTYSGYKAVKKLLEDKVTIDGIFCANDQMAVGALKACEEYGIRVPEDIAIIGNDDVFVATIVTPALSSIHVPKLELGATAMKRLEARMRAPQKNMKARTITLETTLIKRESTVVGAKNSLKYIEW